MEPQSHQSIRQAIEAGNYHEALRLLTREPAESSETLYLQAVCARKLRKPREAMAVLDKLIQLHPRHGRAFQERGHILRAEGNAQGALAAFGRATEENPSLHVSWRGQAEILLAAGRIQEAERIKPHIQRLVNMPKPLIYALDMLSQGSIAKAEQACREFLGENPHHVEAMRLLAQIAMKMNVFDEAEFLLESAVLFEPEDIPLKTDYINVLRKRQKLVEARENALELFENDKESLYFKSQYAVISMQLGDYETALTLFDELLTAMPGEPVTLTSKGHALKTVGDTDAAISCYQEACREGVIHGEAWQSLANLKTYKFEESEVARMEGLLKNPALRKMDRVYLHFGLGKAYEDRREYDLAFSNYASGNQIKRAESRYIAQHMSEEFEEQKRVFSTLAPSREGFEAPDPIFIVGMPRAGSTLLEQILSSHSQVDGTQELPNILSAVHQLRSRNKDFDRLNYPRAILDLSPDELRDFGRAYIEDTRTHRKEAPFFIDKMPNNFRHIGLIKRILPNAKIIDARRHPLSCTFSCFKQLFAEGQEFSYHLEDLGHYYRDYVGLMDFWHQCLPNEILHVQYEEVVDDLETQVRRILAHCNLPFEEACLNFWETERAVKTPSSEQVRQPIFKSGVENWQDFEVYLNPLKQALGKTLHEFLPQT
ncbi:sulfotransferase [Gammaproteobacteria bacterium]|nr:sulfotransferase [Gammaproteobacteria bacterium]